MSINVSTRYREGNTTQIGIIAGQHDTANGRWRGARNRWVDQVLTLHATADIDNTCRIKVMNGNLLRYGKMIFIIARNHEIACIAR